MPETPYLVVDLDVAKTNQSRLFEFAKSHGIALRPHVKTHKLLSLAKLQLEGGAIGITVATVSEAERFAANGFKDIFIAYPVFPSAKRLERVLKLHEQINLSVGVDSLEALDRWAQIPKLQVVVELNSGHNRSGVEVTELAQLIDRALERGLLVKGVFTYPGHSYSPDNSAAKDESDVLFRAQGILESHGLPVYLSGGSSPTSYQSVEPITELRSGVYLLNDAQQLELGKCELHQIALWCEATVVSLHKDRAILDSGSKILGADRPAFVSGHGRLLDYPEARITALSEHHATVKGADLEYGQRVRVVPNHVCNAMNLVDQVFLKNGDALTSEALIARGMNH